MMKVRLILLTTIAACLAIAGQGTAQEPTAGASWPAGPADFPSPYPMMAPPGYGGMMDAGASYADPSMYGVIPAGYGQDVPLDAMGYGDYADDGMTMYGDYAYEGVITPHFDGGCATCSLGNCQCSNTTKFWGSIEYLAWFSHARSAPPLVTTSPTGTAQANAGILGLNTTTVLYGGERVGGDDLNSGGRLTLGYWLDPYREIGVAGRLYGVSEDRADFFRSSQGNPILAIPFFNATAGAQDALLVAFPNIVTGSVDIRNSNQVWGAEALGRVLIHRELAEPWLLPYFWYRLDLLGGYHFSRVDDTLQISSALVSVDPMGLVPVGTTIDVTDRFDVRNEFHGGTIGIMGEMERNRFTLQFLGKASFGNMREVVTISGRQVITEPNMAPVSADTGLFVQTTNRGTYHRDEFAVIPEGTLTLNYRWTERIDLSVGYTFMYWSTVVLAGNQIDTRINPPQGNNPTGPLPAFSFKDTDHWVQGVNFGLRWHY